MKFSEHFALKCARTLAKRFGLFVVVKPDALLVYREAEPRNIYIGKSKTANGAYDIVRKVTGQIKA